MHREKEKEEIHDDVLSLSSNLHQRRYPDELRERIIAYTETALAQAAGLFYSLMESARLVGGRPRQLFAVSRDRGAFGRHAFVAT